LEGGEKMNWRKGIERLGVKVLSHSFKIGYDDSKNFYIPHSPFFENPWQWLFWALFGNDENGMEQVLYEDQCWTGRAFAFWIRNPLQNFNHYALGIDPYSDVTDYGLVYLTDYEFSTGKRYDTYNKGIHLLWMRTLKKHPHSLIPNKFRVPFFTSKLATLGYKRAGNFGMGLNLTGNHSIGEITTNEPYVPLYYYVIPFFCVTLLLQGILYVVALVLWFLVFLRSLNIGN